MSTHQPAGDGLGQEDSGQAVRQYVRIKDILLHIYRILHTKLEIYVYKFCKNNNLMGFKHIFYITFIIFFLSYTRDEVHKTHLCLLFMLANLNFLKHFSH